MANASVTPSAFGDTDFHLMEAKGGRGPRFLPVLFILFLGSGCSALIYEIVWFQLLEFAIGSSATSIAVLLGTFMGGLCLGSLLFGRLVSRKWHPMRAYALLELGIGALAVLITTGLPAVDRWYALMAHGVGAGVGYRALIAVICLLPPTVLMGATLPAISRWIETTPRGVSWLGFFYGGNTVGAVVGCLVAGFYLLPTYTMAAASYVAALINVSVAVIALLVSLAASYTPTEEEKSSGEVALPRVGGGVFNRTSIYVAIGLSGMAALGAEVIWTRLLSLLLGATVYTFSIILAVFLVGLGIGSSIGAMLTRFGINARVALAWCQILCVAGIAWTAYAVTNGLPNMSMDKYIAMAHGHRFVVDLGRCAWAILPATLFWGASFPLALSAMVSGKAGGGGDPARAVGRVYAANTVGAIVGALFFALFAVRMWGSQSSEHLLMFIAGLAAVMGVIPGFLLRAGNVVHKRAWRLGVTGLLLLVALGAPFVAVGILSRKHLDTVPWELIAWGRDATSRMREPSWGVVAMGEGVNSSVAVTTDGQDMFFHVAGKVEASTIPLDMRLQLMLGHFPSLFHAEPSKPKKVLIVGCGAGVTAGSFVVYPHEKIVLCEMEPLVPQMAAHFSAQNNEVVTKNDRGEYVDPKVQVVFDDARHFMLTTDEKFDIITSDPIHPWVKGAACLYTQEYFESVKARLNKGGLVTQWVPLYESDVEVVKSEIKTFFEVFPNGTIWTNSDGGGGYDVVLMGSVEPMVIDEGTLQARLDDHPLISGILSGAELGDAQAVLGTYGGRAADLKEWTTGGQVNHDSNLRLQYLAGLANNEVLATEIQQEILNYRKFPEGMLEMSAAERAALEKSWGLKPSVPAK